jgi:hypothetical protein
VPRDPEPELCPACGDPLDDYSACPCIFAGPRLKPGDPKKGANMKTWGMREMVHAKLKRQGKR